MFFYSHDDERSQRESACRVACPNPQIEKATLGPWVLGFISKWKPTWNTRGQTESRGYRKIRNGNRKIYLATLPCIDFLFVCGGGLNDLVKQGNPMFIYHGETNETCLALLRWNYYNFAIGRLSIMMMLSLQQSLLRILADDIFGMNSKAIHLPRGSGMCTVNMF